MAIPLSASGRILTLHLNYVAGYTDPLPFFFDRTHNYPVDGFFHSVVWVGPKFLGVRLLG